MSGRIRDAQGRFTADPFAAVRDAARKAEADALAVYRTACQPVPGGEWDNLFAQISDQVNQARIDMHRRVDQAYALILGEVPVREAPVAFIHQRGVVLELGGAAEEQIASAWSTWDAAMAGAARDTAGAEVAHEPHPSGPLPAVTGPMPSWADDDAELDEKIKAIFGEAKFRAIRDDTAWSGMRLAPPDVPGPVEDPPTPGPGTPGKPDEAVKEGDTE